MTTPERQGCPACGAVCELKINLDGVAYLTLERRVVALGPAPCTVTCPECGNTRTGSVEDLDIDGTTGLLQFGTITLDQ